MTQSKTRFSSTDFTCYFKIYADRLMSSFFLLLHLKIAHHTIDNGADGCSLRKCANDIPVLFILAVGCTCGILRKVVAAGDTIRSEQEQEQALSFSPLPVGVTVAIVVC
jgi:hypothetical protein